MTDSQLALIIERERLKHTLGNLTLLTSARNPSIGNEDFKSKRAAFRQSLLRLNREIAEVESWTEGAIRARNLRLAELATKVWPSLPGCS